MEQKVPRLVLAGTNSGCGKTTVTCAVLQALVSRGLRVGAAKCGPDYIDPMFHSRVIGAKSSNLDSFFFDRDTMRYLLAHNGQDCDITVIEGVMGYYDGLGLTSTRASTYEAARSTDSPVVLVVTMTVGFVTPTEAGIVGLVYSIIVGIIYKEITIKSFLEACQQTVITCALIMFLMGLGSAVGWLLTAENVPRQLSNAMLSVTDNKYVILLFINVILLILGMFMDGTTIQLIMVPLLMPIMSALNVSLLQFGVMVTINIMIGTITPPFGTGLFITATVAGVKMEELIKYCLIFMAPLLVGLLLITYVPFFTTWLPGILFA